MKDLIKEMNDARSGLQNQTYNRAQKKFRLGRKSNPRPLRCRYDTPLSYREGGT